MWEGEHRLGRLGQLVWTASGAEQVGCCGKIRHLLGLVSFELEVSSIPLLLDNLVGRGCGDAVLLAAAELCHI